MFRGPVSESLLVFANRDMGQDVRDESFVFGLTFEDAWQNEDKQMNDPNHVKKVIQ